MVKRQFGLKECTRIGFGLRVRVKGGVRCHRDEKHNEMKIWTKEI